MATPASEFDAQPRAADGRQIGGWPTVWHYLRWDHSAVRSGARWSGRAGRGRMRIVETEGTWRTGRSDAGRCATRLLILTLLLVASAGCRDDASPPGTVSKPTSLADWKAQRAELDETVWADEALAQEYERTLVALWDELLGTGRDPAAKLAVLASLEFETLTAGAPRAVEELEHGIRSFVLDASSRVFARAGWDAFLNGLGAEGYRLIQSEWHHARFFPANAASPARSSIAVVLHVIDDGADRRIIVEGEVAVEWYPDVCSRASQLPRRHRRITRMAGSAKYSDWILPRSP